MLPKSGNPELPQAFDFIAQPGLTYRLDIDNKRFGGRCDKIEAVKQAVYKILSTERYKYAIYSWKYGVELEDLFGKPLNYVMAEVPERIRDALLQDDRIEDVADFHMERAANQATGLRNTLQVRFTVITAEGDFEASKAVSY